MSVNDEETLPWLAEEKEMIQRTVKNGKPALDICFGAQLIASAYGATAYRFVNETGWFPANLGYEASGIFLEMPESFHVFQLHGNTVHLPVRARLQCTGSTVHQEGFRLKSALVLQFPPEMTRPLIADWINDLPKTRQGRIMSKTNQYLGGSTKFCRMVAEEFISFRHL